MDEIQPDDLQAKQTIRFDDPPRSIEQLAAEQGVAPVTEFDTLLGDFWPEDEPIEEFISALRRWRHTDSYGRLP